MKHYINCAVCGEKTERRGGAQKYCPKCAEDRKKEQIADYIKRMHDRIVEEKRLVNSFRL